MANIFRWDCSSPPGVAAFTTLKGVDSQWAIDIANGRELPEEFPSDDAYFDMDPQHPRDVKLGEQHYNIERMVVIGPRLSDFIRNLDVPSLQLLSVKIRDHKGRIASSDFNIVHTTLVVDCLDTEASGAVWNPINEDHIVSWGTLTLRDDVAELPRIFRVSHLPGWIFVNEETAQAIEELGLKEPYLTELDSV